MHRPPGSPPESGHDNYYLRHREELPNWQTTGDQGYSRKVYRSGDFTVLDVETTGIYKSSRVVELAMLRFENGKMKSWQQYFNPKCEVPAEAHRVNGLSLRFLKDYETFDKHIGEILEFVNGSVIVGWNVSFDLAHIGMEMHRAGVADLKMLGAGRICHIDAMRLARSLHPGVSYSLQNMASVLGLNTGKLKAHSALDDTTLTTLAWEKMVRSLSAAHMSSA